MYLLIYLLCNKNNNIWQTQQSTLLKGIWKPFFREQQQENSIIINKETPPFQTKKRKKVKNIMKTLKTNTNTIYIYWIKKTIYTIIIEKW